MENERRSAPAPRLEIALDSIPERHSKRRSSAITVLTAHKAHVRKFGVGHLDNERAVRAARI
jgi:hypothetical protein